MNPIASHLERVATRLNRVALQRALYSTLGAAGLAIAIYAIATHWLTGPALPLLAAALGLLWTLMGLRSYRRVSTHWAGDLSAARWIEQRVPLQQRLITLVSTRGELGSSPLWTELESDNYARLPSWSDEPLGIPTIPANIALLALGVAAAAVAVSTWPPSPGEHPPPLRTQSQGAASPHGAMAREGDGRESPMIVPGTEPGAAGAEGATEAGNGHDTGAAGDRTAAAEASAGTALTNPIAGPANQEQRPTSSLRGEDPGPADQRSLSVRATLGPPQPAPMKPLPGQEAAAAAPQTGGQEQLDEADTNEPVATKPHERPSGSAEPRGTRPGDAPGSGPLFSREALEQGTGAPGPDFALPLRAAAGGGTAAGDPQSAMQSSIAKGQRVPQRPASNIRRQEIPPQYETALRRIFERNP